MDDRKVLGARIREIRKLRGLSLEAVAEKIEGSWRYLSSVERGKENPTLDFLVRLKGALKVELVDFFNAQWHAMSERELKKKVQALVTKAEVDELREMLALLRLKRV